MCKLFLACLPVLHLGDRWYIWQPILPLSRWWMRWSWPLPTINVNCQCLRNKPQLLQNLADSSKSDIIIGTESWLTKEVNNCKAFEEGYGMSAVRRNRQDLPWFEDSRGGGVFVLIIKDNIIGVHQESTETNGEIVCVKFDIVGTKSVYVAAYYHPLQTR